MNEDDNFAVEATQKVENASLFYVIPKDDGVHPYDFIIGYYGDRQLTRMPSTLSLQDKQVESVPRYLNVPVNLAGENPGPLHLQFAVQEKHSRLTLHSRLVKKYSPVDTRTWVSGRDLCFINCSHRKWKRDGYICVKLTIDQGQQPRLITACVSSVKKSNERNLCMLFRLLPASYRDVPLKSKVKGEEQENTEEEEDFENGPEKLLSRLVLLKPKRSSSHLQEDSSSYLQEDRISGQRHLDTTGAAIPSPVAGLDLPELSVSPASGPTRVTFATTPSL